MTGCVICLTHGEAPLRFVKAAAGLEYCDAVQGAAHFASVADATAYLAVRGEVVRDVAYLGRRPTGDLPRFVHSPAHFITAVTLVEGVALQP